MDVAFLSIANNSLMYNYTESKTPKRKLKLNLKFFKKQ